MGGSTKVVDTTPKDITGLRSMITQYLMGSPGQAAAGGGPRTGGPMSATPGALPGGGFEDQFRHLLGIVPTAPGGPQPGAASPLDRINAGGVPLPGRVELGGAPTIGPGDISRIGGLPQATTDYQGLLGPNVGRGAVRDITAPGIGGVGTQSVDQLGGVNSAFFNNMVAQLAPLFNQQRAQAIAQAKEGAGNLTGSGFGNILGEAVNRSLGQQQATLADYASRGLDTEVNRQLGLAGLNTQRDLEQARLQFGAGQGNQQADQAFLQYMLSRGATGAELGQRGEFANIDTALRGSLANQQTDLQRMLANQGIQGQYGLTQAQLDQARNMGIFGTQSDIANQNAQRFFQLLQAMGLGGVGPGTVTQSGGIGSILGPIGSILGTALGPGGAIAKHI